jgi:hypothetical protein
VWRSRVAVVATYLLVLALSVELAVWESFLVGARPFGVAFPISAVLAVVGNVILGRAGARVLRRRAGAVGPGIVWLAVALTIGSSRPEGDTIVPDTLRGLAFLLAGTVSAALVVGSQRSFGTTPERPSDR